MTSPFWMIRTGYGSTVLALTSESIVINITKNKKEKQINRLPAQSFLPDLLLLPNVTKEFSKAEVIRRPKYRFNLNDLDQQLIFIGLQLNTLFC